MAIDRPNLHPFDWLFDAVCIIGGGSAWPDGDEDVLRELADAWRDLGNQLNKSLADADNAAVQVLTAWGGDAGEAFDSFWSAIAVGPSNGLPQIIDAAQNFGDASDDAAMQIEYAKLVLTITLLVTVITLVVCQVLAIFTGGGSEAVAAGEVAAARTVAGQIFQQLMKWIGKNLLRKILAKFIMHEVQQVVVQVGADYLAQEIQIKEGTRKSLDTESLEHSLISAAITGVLTFPAGLIPVKFPAGWQKMATNALIHTVNNTIAMPASMMLTQGLTTGNWDWDNLTKGISLSTFLDAALMGGGMGVIGHARLPDSVRNRINPRAIDPTAPGARTSAPDTAPEVAPENAPDVTSDGASSGSPDVTTAPSDGVTDTPTGQQGTEGTGTGAGTDTTGAPAATENTGTSGTDATSNGSGDSAGGRDSAAAGGGSLAPDTDRPSGGSVTAPADAPTDHPAAQPDTRTAGGTTTDQPTTTEPATSTGANRPAITEPVTSADRPAMTEPGPGDRSVEPVVSTGDRGQAPVGDPAAPVEERAPVPEQESPTAPAATEAVPAENTAAPVEPSREPAPTGTEAATGREPAVARTDRPADQTRTDPATETTRTDPSRTDPGRTDPGRTDPGRTETARTDPTKSATAPADRSTGGSRPTDAPRGDQRAPDSSRTDSSRTDSTRSGDGRSDPKKAADAQVAAVLPLIEQRSGELALAGSGSGEHGGPPARLGGGHDGTTVTSDRPEQTTPSPDRPAAKDGGSGGGSGDGGGGNDGPPPPGEHPGNEYPAEPSTTKTAQGTRSYEGPVKQFEGDPQGTEAKRAVTHASREFADSVRDKMRSQGLGTRNRVRMSGAMLSDEHGTTNVRTHSSMRTISPGDGSPRVEPRIHPEAQHVLDRIAAEAEADPNKRIGANHGKCAEIALISDRLWDLQAQWEAEGSPGDFATYAREHLGGSIMSTHWVGDSTKQSHGDYEPPCDTCKPFMDDFRIQAVDPRDGFEPPPDQPPHGPGGPGDPPPGSPPSHPSAPHGQESQSREPQPPAPPGDLGAVGQGVPLEDTRPYGSELAPPYEQHQEILEALVPRGPDGEPLVHPDPRRGDWAARVNDGGSRVSGRANNCVDVSMSFLSTWYGDPTVAASMLDPSLAGETGGPARIVDWTQSNWDHLGTDRAALNEAAARLREAGPGSSAVVVVEWTSKDTGHAFNAVNVDGTVVWVDAQIGAVSDIGPVHDSNISGVWSIVLGADGEPFTPGTRPESLAPAYTSPESSAPLEFTLTHDDPRTGLEPSFEHDEGEYTGGGYDGGGYDGGGYDGGGDPYRGDPHGGRDPYGARNPYGGDPYGGERYGGEPGTGERYGDRSDLPRHDWTEATEATEATEGGRAGDGRSPESGPPDHRGPGNPRGDDRSGALGDDGRAAPQEPRVPTQREAPSLEHLAAEERTGPEQRGPRDEAPRTDERPPAADERPIPEQRRPSFDDRTPADERGRSGEPTPPFDDRRPAGDRAVRDDRFGRDDRTPSDERARPERTPAPRDEHDGSPSGREGAPPHGRNDTPPSGHDGAPHSGQGAPPPGGHPALPEVGAREVDSPEKWTEDDLETTSVKLARFSDPLSKDAAGKYHFPGDAKNTYRTSEGKPRYYRSGQWAPDPRAGEMIDLRVKAEQGVPTSHDLSAGATGDVHRASQAWHEANERILATEREQRGLIGEVNRQIARLNEAGSKAIAEIKPSDLNSRNLRGTERRLIHAGLGDELIDRITDASERLSQAHAARTRAVNAIGMYAGRDYVLSELAKGADSIPVEVHGDPTAQPRSGELDIIGLKWDPNDPGHSRLVIVEAKGGAGEIGTRVVEGYGRVQQGSAPYLAHFLEHDPTLRQLFRDNPGLADAIRDGTLRPEYYKVSQDVLRRLSGFEPDGKPRVEVPAAPAAEVRQFEFRTAPNILDPSRLDLSGGSGEAPPGSVGGARPVETDGLGAHAGPPRAGDSDGPPGTRADEPGGHDTPGPSEGGPGEGGPGGGGPGGGGPDGEGGPGVPGGPPRGDSGAPPAAGGSQDSGPDPRHAALGHELGGAYHTDADPARAHAALAGTLATPELLPHGAVVDAVTGHVRLRFGGETGYEVRFETAPVREQDIVVADGHRYAPTASVRYGSDHAVVYLSENASADHVRRAVAASLAEVDSVVGDRMAGTRSDVTSILGEGAIPSGRARDGLGPMDRGRAAAMRALVYDLRAAESAGDTARVAQLRTDAAGMAVAYGLDDRASPGDIHTLEPNRPEVGDAARRARENALNRYLGADNREVGTITASLMGDDGRLPLADELHARRHADRLRLADGVRELIARRHAADALLSERVDAALAGGIAPVFDRLIVGDGWAATSDYLNLAPGDNRPGELPPVMCIGDHGEPWLRRGALETGQLPLELELRGLPLQPSQFALDGTRFTRSDHFGLAVGAARAMSDMPTYRGSVTSIEARPEGAPDWPDGAMYRVTVDGRPPMYATAVDVASGPGPARIPGMGERSPAARLVDPATRFSADFASGTPTYRDPSGGVVTPRDLPREVRVRFGVDGNGVPLEFRGRPVGPLLADNAGRLTDPRVVDPATGVSVDPDTQRLYDPGGRPIHPSSVDPVALRRLGFGPDGFRDPRFVDHPSGYSVHPSTGQIVRTGDRAPVDLGDLPPGVHDELQRAARTRQVQFGGHNLAGDYRDGDRVLVYGAGASGAWDVEQAAAGPGRQVHWTALDTRGGSHTQAEVDQAFREAGGYNRRNTDEHGAYSTQVWDRVRRSLRSPVEVVQTTEGRLRVRFDTGDVEVYDRVVFSIGQESSYRTGVADLVARHKLQPLYGVNGEIHGLRDGSGGLRLLGSAGVVGRPGTPLADLLPEHLREPASALVAEQASVLPHDSRNIPPSIRNQAGRIADVNLTVDRFSPAVVDPHGHLAAVPRAVADDLAAAGVAVRGLPKIKNQDRRALLRYGPDSPGSVALLADVPVASDDRLSDAVEDTLRKAWKVGANEIVLDARGTGLTDVGADAVLGRFPPPLRGGVTVRFIVDDGSLRPPPTKGQ